MNKVLFKDNVKHLLFVAKWSGLKFNKIGNLSKVITIYKTGLN